MPAIVLALIVLVALLLPVAPFAINHGARQIHARRHAACLHRIAQLEYDLGMYSPDSPRLPMRTAAQAAEAWSRGPDSAAAAVDRYTAGVLRWRAARANAAREKAWNENRKRTIREMNDRYYRRGHGR